MSSEAKRKPEEDKSEEEPPEKKTKEEEDTSVDNQEDVLKLVKEETLVILDARRDDEMLESGFMKTSAPGHRLVHVSCKRDEAPLLVVAAKHMIPDKGSKY